MDEDSSLRYEYKFSFSLVALDILDDFPTLLSLPIFADFEVLVGDPVPPFYKKN